LPDKPPPLFAAALSAGTARWAGGWADGLITVSQPRDKLRELIQAFREGGGEGKPVRLQVKLSWAPDEAAARDGALEQWRTNIFDGSVAADLRTPAQFEAAAKFVHETRMLSLYRCRIGRQRPYPAAVSNIRQDHWMGYYIVRAPGQGGEGGEEGGVRAASQEALELRVTRVVGEGMHEDLDLTNYTQQPTSFRLSFELD